ncbi:MAG: EAL domain-containing protein, partial [Mollicutes bacterium]|nr:EAL domain-containing protein [Mollicutes bacterium]
FNDSKRLGFDEVKIDRNIIKDIDIDPVKLNEVKEMCNDAKDAQIKISVIGIERKEQIGLLKEIDNIEFMQGYYFYKPLEVDEFISLVKTFNLKVHLN